MAAVRTLVVHCPEWPIVAAGVEPGAPAAVLHANRVVAVSPVARDEGVVPGLRRREAQARCPELAVIAHDPARDARAFEAVIGALEVLTPRIEIIAAGTCAFATRGPSRYFGGDRSLAERAELLAADALGARTGVAGPPRAGVADGLFAASLAARAGVTVVPPGTSAAFLAPLPAETLDRDDLVGLLARLGLRTLGQFAELPEASVVARFGADGALAHRLARGLDGRPLVAGRPRLELAVTAELDPPADRIDRVAFVAKTLADELHARLSGLGVACTRVAIEAETEHDERLVRLWRHEGALSAAAIAERVRWQLDGWWHSPRRPTGGISLLRLVPDEVEAETGHQLGFWGGRTLADGRAARALARIQGLLGPEAVRRPERRGGRSPIEAVVAVPVGMVDPDDHRAGPAASRVDAPWPGRLPAPSPALVHQPPLAANVLDGSGRPVTVDGRGQASAAPAWVEIANRAARAVTAWAGPWPLDERWWDAADRRRRARFQVVTDAGTAHLLVLERGQWSVEATYD